jgi:hypothetical protein
MGLRRSSSGASICARRQVGDLGSCRVGQVERRTDRGRARSPATPRVVTASGHAAGTMFGDGGLEDRCTRSDGAGMQPGLAPPVAAVDGHDGRVLTGAADSRPHDRCDTVGRAHAFCPSHSGAGRGVEPQRVLQLGSGPGRSPYPQRTGCRECGATHVIVPARTRDGLPRLK